MRVDTLVGMGFSNIIALFIMLTTAATLHAHDVKPRLRRPRRCARRRPLCLHDLWLSGLLAPNMSRSNTPSVSPKPESSPPSAASATLTTTRWPRRSTAFTRLRSSIDADRGAPSRPSSSQPSSGWTGSLGVHLHQWPSRFAGLSVCRRRRGADLGGGQSASGRGKPRSLSRATPLRTLPVMETAA
jgi:hypothetical protein